MSVPKNEAQAHPLLTREIRPIHNWHEWLARWQAAEDLQWMESLLHCGFNITLGRMRHEEPEYVPDDRYIFYLTIADGWTDDGLLRLQTDGDKQFSVGHDSNWNVIRKSLSKIRQQLARKAFDMLCLNFFRTKLLEGGDKSNNVWEKLFVHERLFPTIQNFFRIEKGRLGYNAAIRNLSRLGEKSHNEQQAVNFILNLVEFIWTWKEPEMLWFGSGEQRESEKRKCLAEMRARVDTAKPWTIEVLAALNKIDMLRKWILEIDKACLAKLKEIALRNEISEYRHPVTKTRLVATLDEARYIGSKTAWLLAEQELVVREHKRLKAICEAQRNKENADRKIRELTTKA